MEMADAVQSQWREVGIEVNVQKMAREAYLDFVRNYQHNLSASAGTNFDPDELRVRYHSTMIERANFANLADPELDALMEKGNMQELGSAERRQTYEDAQRRLMDLLPFVSIMTQVRIEAMAAKVHDLKMVPHGLNAYPLTDMWMEA
jgi:ABC-type transport system substrate-binding protein